MERRARRGRRVAALDARPELYDDLLPIWEAFCSLHTARGAGPGAEPLRVGDVSAWLGLYDIPANSKPEYFELIRILDDVWLDHIRAEMKEQADGNTKGRNRRKRSNSRR